MKRNAQRSGDERLTAEERREAILEAAVTEFADFGFHGASTERIAAAVGISQPYVFRLFGTKKELFRACVNRVITEIKETIRTSVAADPSNPLAAVSDAFMRLMYRRNALVLLLQAFALAKHPDILDVGRQQMAQMYEYVSEVTGKSSSEVQEFFAFGMLFVVAASLDLPAIAAEQPWAAALIRRWPHQENEQ